mmetsp:Transcript_101575/g.303066  ORF Transcript_101575/g.303066 Transcript_101575/m.303066 type:complete len:230 (+) Transcript_101575:113-802(+)
MPLCLGHGKHALLYLLVPPAGQTGASASSSPFPWFYEHEPEPHFGSHYANGNSDLPCPPPYGNEPPSGQVWLSLSPSQSLSTSNEVSNLSWLPGTTAKIPSATATSAAAIAKATWSGQPRTSRTCQVALAAAGAPSWQTSSTRDMMPNATPLSWGPSTVTRLVRMMGNIIALAKATHTTANSSQPRTTLANRIHVVAELSPASIAMLLAETRRASAGMQTSRPRPLAAK